jgi:hypothetical protein
MSKGIKVALFTGGNRGIGYDLVKQVEEQRKEIPI